MTDNITAHRKHNFVGRAQELLTAQHILAKSKYVSITGPMGVGKTAMARELARQITGANHIYSVAFIPALHIGDVRDVLDTLGRQLIPEYQAGDHQGTRAARMAITQSLCANPTIIVIDNLGAPSQEHGEAEILDLCAELLNDANNTRLVLTSPKDLPAPFDEMKYTIKLGALTPDDAISLVSHVLAAADLAPLDTAPKQAMDKLVNALNYHPHALVLISPKLVQTTIADLTDQIQDVMKDLKIRYPDIVDHARNASMANMASVECALRRLPDTQRQQIKHLALFQGGAHHGAMAIMLDDDDAAAAALLAALVSVDLATEQDYGHFDLDPSLAPYLLDQLDDYAQQELSERWLEAMEDLAGFLDQQQFQDRDLATRLITLELPNLVALAERLAARDPDDDETREIIRSVEQMLAFIGRAAISARLMTHRASATSTEWDHDQFQSALAEIKQLRDSGKIAKAFSEAEKLLQTAISQGDSAYPRAAHDIAHGFFTLGWTLQGCSQYDAALEMFDETVQRFTKLSQPGDHQPGDQTFEQIMTQALTGSAECLRELGRLEEASSTEAKIAALAGT